MTALSYRRFIHLGVNPKGSSTLAYNLAEMQKVIENYLRQNAGDWYRYAAQNYVVWTHETLNEITSHLRQQPGLENTYMVASELSPNSCSGWMPKAFWDWLFRYRA